MANKEVAFQNWLERKNEEYKSRRQQEEEQRQRELATEKQRRELGKHTYHKWLRATLKEDEILKKEKIRQRQQMQLLLEEHNKKRQQSLREYQSWKDRKDAELILQRNERGISHRIHTPHRVSTPPLPGYCSVWSCDLQMANIMLSRVERPVSHALTETCNYTICHDKHMKVT